MNVPGLRGDTFTIACLFRVTRKGKVRLELSVVFHTGAYLVVPPSASDDPSGICDFAHQWLEDPKLIGPEKEEAFINDKLSPHAVAQTKPMSTDGWFEEQYTVYIWGPLYFLVFYSSDSTDSCAYVCRCGHVDELVLMANYKLDFNTFFGRCRYLHKDDFSRTGLRHLLWELWERVHIACSRFQKKKRKQLK